ncbi:MAG TPA: CBS domain-containing protein [Candidatus Acidoferrales bacterium]|nr:CBS domain-containing protein [Candidatus Acidoferrales bacterium]
MNVSRIVTRPLITIASGRTVLDAAKLMLEKNIGLLVIIQGQDSTKVVGVISERDIIRTIASGRPLSMPVDDVCTKRVVTVRGNSDVAEAAKAMNKNTIRHVVVVDDKETPIGVVSMRDLVGERATLTAILQSDEKEIFHGGD